MVLSGESDTGDNGVAVDGVFFGAKDCIDGILGEKIAHPICKGSGLNDMPSVVSRILRVKMPEVSVP